MFTPVIMAGGSGSRLWPLSRSAFPKQFLSLNGENSETMLQSTFERVKGLTNSVPIVISNEVHRFIVAEQIRKSKNKASIILEPEGRNTAPAIALAALKAMEHGEDPILLVLPADHLIKDKQAFQASLKAAIEPASMGMMVTFGIIPTAPETGYGYIHRGEYLDNNVFKVSNFVEKPRQSIAEKYIESGNYYWNSGCFMFKASEYLDELKKYSPEIYECCEKAIKDSINEHDFIRVSKEEFLKSPDNSIDYAVMESTEKAVVVPMDAGWSDVGSWSALWDVSNKDKNGNVIHGDAITQNSSNCYIYAPNKLVASVGVNNIVVVETKDAVLVADKDSVQQVKNVVEHLKAENRAEFREHREVYRPWGKSDAIDKGERYKVNRVSVQPGKKLSQQLHYHRAEHWVVVLGTAKVSIYGEEQIITENQSFYIPVGVGHIIENPGKITLELIEIQSGSYLDEDDIVRL